MKKKKHKKGAEKEEKCLITDFSRSVLGCGEQKPTRFAALGSFNYYSQKVECKLFGSKNSVVLCSIVVFHFPSSSLAIHILQSIPVVRGGERSDGVAVLLYAQNTILLSRRPLVVEAVMFLQE